MAIVPAGPSRHRDFTKNESKVLAANSWGLWRGRIVTAPCPLSISQCNHDEIADG
ncbi:hypothetical protein IG631_22590 [Alternaria alternata]|jgi:hypothetical protein|nr:hypothetical protein IG631_22590 [Alternaria alternata]